MPLIRTATPDDLEAVLALTIAFANSFAIDEAAFGSSFMALLADPTACLAVAEEPIGSAIIGYILGLDHNTLFANGRVAWVEEITVRADRRGQGTGRLLMNYFEAWAASRGAKLIALATRRAAAFYLALGYGESATYFRKVL